MNRPWAWMALFALVVVSLLALRSKGTLRTPLGPSRIAVLPIYGPIEDPGWVLHWLHKYQRQVRGVKAVVLALDSPGGGVAASQEIYEAVKRLRAEKMIVIVSMGSMAASGAYYIASAADKVLANPGTLTGSIGVIMQTVSARHLLDKVGVRFETVKSGEFKDSGGWDRPLNQREKQVFQATIDDVQDQFVSAVAGQRHRALAQVLAREEKRKPSSVSADEVYSYVSSLADGRVYTGRQAVELGLVDRLGTLEDALDLAAELAGLDDPDVITHRLERSFAEWMTGMSRAQMGAWLRQSLGISASPTLQFMLH